ncbi:MAG: aminoacyl-tRNA hydrolase, partial [Chloroflexi bacterium]|nr:aminoacyl-tRNA hydrolase [Chloroflexota bacterium]
KKLFAAAAADRAIFVAPLTFMNESGIAAREALKQFGAKPEDLIVIHDDSDLPVGKYKISRNVRAAGHKGVQSIIDVIGTKDFTRIRIGIRPPVEQRRAKAETFVLKKITKKDGQTLHGIFDAIIANLPSLPLPAQK